MDRSSRQKAEVGSLIVVRNSPDDIVSIASLLLMATASAKIHCPDKVCISLMEKCVERLTERYGISRESLGDDLRIREFIEVPALLRVLRYAQAEATHSLNDAECADLLGECIDRLTKTHRLAQDCLYPPSVAVN
jgi:hypothetical protein